MSDEKKFRITPEMMEAAHAETDRLQRELDITNADHVALWLEANDPYDGDAWLAIQIVEAHERAVAALSTADHATIAEERVTRWRQASVALGAWMSAALDDPKVCAAMKSDIQEWFSAGEPFEAMASDVELVAYRYVHLDYAGRKVSRYGSHPERVNGHDPIETHPLYAHPPTDTRRRALPDSAGICAFDLDECTVTIALDNEDEVRALRKALPGKNRVRLVVTPTTDPIAEAVAGDDATGCADDFLPGSAEQWRAAIRKGGTDA